jgi:hypothetical protein
MDTGSVSSADPWKMIILGGLESLHNSFIRSQLSMFGMIQATGPICLKAALRNVLKGAMSTIRLGKISAANWRASPQPKEWPRKTIFFVIS